MELILEANNVVKIYYDGRRDAPYCLRGTCYFGVLAADCERNTKVVIVDGDQQYEASVWGIERFLETLDKAPAGMEIGLFFSYHYPNLPESKTVKIYRKIDT